MRAYVYKPRPTQAQAAALTTALETCHLYNRALAEREELNVRGMVKNHPLAKHIGDAGWYAFRRILGDKAASAGRVAVAVDAAGTSQGCGGCGSRAPKQPSDRWHPCPFCGREPDRDHNAALNIKTRGGTAFGGPTAPAAALNREPHALQGWECQSSNISPPHLHHVAIEMYRC
jgi:transposase